MARLSTLALLLLVSADAVGGASEQAPPPYSVVHGWPQLPEGRILGSAAGVGVDAHGRVYVFHRAGRVWSEPLPLDPITAPTIAIFDGASGRLVGEWGAGRFAMPHGLTVDAKGNVWLTDVALHQVFKFSAAGEPLLTLGERGVAGADAAHFDMPTDVAVAADGSFYVSDGYGNSRVAKFASDGRFLFQWGAPGGGPGQFDTPHGVALDGKGRVHVADRQNDRVQVFDANGRFQTQWRGPGIGRPYSMALFADGRAVVADGGEQPQSDPDRSGVAIVNSAGRVTARIGRFGNQDGQFRMAHDVAVDAAGDFYVVDIAGQRVQKFTANAPTPP